jgi:hypothetical protein
LSLQPGAHVAELRKLTALTRLHVYHPDGAKGFEESVRGLAAVSQLLDLELRHDIPHFKVASLLPLTALTVLTHFYCWPTSSADFGVRAGMSLSSRAQVLSSGAQVSQ